MLGCNTRNRPWGYNILCYLYSICQYFIISVNNEYDKGDRTPLTADLYHWESTAVEQLVACALVTQWTRVRSPVGTSFLGEVFWGFSSPVRKMSGSFRPPRSPNIIWPSLSSINIHYGRQWAKMLMHPKTLSIHTYIRIIRSNNYKTEEELLADTVAFFSSIIEKTAVSTNLLLKMRTALAQKVARLSLWFSGSGIRSPARW